ncbi:hypothetical protein ACE38W_17630 [Chitinophaga sp. Hz27]|uniref:hypothetical protein n=1 Tax=Chitinophaga sp. Hz27 TaxID=3347169 RepID=UPI0035D7E325
MRKKKSVTRKFVSKHIIDSGDLQKENFSATIVVLRQNAAAKDILLPDAEIANSIDITISTYNEYMSNSENVPEEIYVKLRSIYSEFLKGKIYIIESFHSHHDPYTEMGTEELDDI